MIKHYKNLVETFGEMFTSISVNSRESIGWPEGFGVYVVWEKNRDALMNLKYIGLTGKFNKDLNGELILNQGQFSKRAMRWTPYRFCESPKDGEYQYSFRFNPKFSNVNDQYKVRHQSDAYSKTLFYKDGLLIDFFKFNESLDENYGYTPASLEAELLSKFLIETRNLPPANNSL